MDKTFTKARTSEISARTYNLTIGGMLFYGFFINMIMCLFFTDVFMTWNPIALLVGYFISCIVGIFMSKSHNPIMSFITYNLVVLPIGVVLSLFLKDVYASVVVNAFIVTTVLTATFLVAAAVYPDFFKSLGKTLFFSLLILLIVEFVMILIGFYIPTIIDIIACIIFCGYIGYDWAKAQSLPYTYDNAIDSALELYLDIINLFIRLVEILGKKKD